jgi:hypothetical protein
MGEWGPEEGHRRRSLTVEPATGGRGDQTGRERQARDGAAAASASVRVDGCCALQGERGGGQACEREGRRGGKGGGLADRRGGGLRMGRRRQASMGAMATGT